jgi:hypothetical protein
MNCGFREPKPVFQRIRLKGDYLGGGVEWMIAFFAYFKLVLSGNESGDESSGT